MHLQWVQCTLPSKWISQVEINQYFSYLKGQFMIRGPVFCCFAKSLHVTVLSDSNYYCITMPWKFVFEYSRAQAHNGIICMFVVDSLITLFLCFAKSYEVHFPAFLWLTFNMLFSCFCLFVLDCEKKNGWVASVEKIKALICNLFYGTKLKF